MIFYSARFRKACSLSGGNTVGKPSSFTFSFFCSSVFSFRNLAPSTMTAVPPLLPHLKAISKEPPSCTLLTLDGGRVEVATHISPLILLLLCFGLHTCYQLCSIRAHNLYHDNRQLMVLAINCNHLASKNNCN